MKNFWEKFKELVNRAWNGLTKIGKILFGLIIIASIVLISFALAKDTDENKHNEDTPEIAQVYEPSIGTPLPADNATEITRNVSGASTAEPSEPTSTTEPTINFVAPLSGVDPNEPVSYSNTNHKFAAILPAGSNVSEEDSQIIFSSKNKSLLYLVSINKSSENLNDIESQLRNSTSANNISQTIFAGIQALRFSAKSYGTGIVFINNGKIFYLLGNKDYFSTFKLL